MILIAAATPFEIKNIIDFVNQNPLYEDIIFSITGIGIAATAYSLTKAINNKKPDIIIQAGIAGAFNHDLKIGDVVLVKSETWSDLGIEDNNRYLTLFETNLLGINTPPYRHGEIPFTGINGFDHLKRVKAITSNTAHGNDNTINNIIEKFNPEIETMEGAAAAYVCASENIPFIQIRAISNYVEKRDKSKWNIPLAISRLNEEIITYLTSARRNILS